MHAAPTAVEDCSPDQLPRGVEELSRADVERRCTRVVAHGSVGPFLIGAAKRQILDALSAEGVRRIALMPDHQGVLAARDPQLERVVATSPGILIRSGDDPDPLRVEFAAGVVAHAIGGAAGLDPLRPALAPGRSRADVFASLRAYAGHVPIEIEAFVPGGGAISLPFDPETQLRVLASEHWRFDASSSLCGFDAFYSRVDLIFEDAGHLVRLEHFCFPYELP